MPVGLQSSKGCGFDSRRRGPIRRSSTDRALEYVPPRLVAGPREKEQIPANARGTTGSRVRIPPCRSARRVAQWVEHDKCFTPLCRRAQFWKVAQLAELRVLDSPVAGSTPALPARNERTRSRRMPAELQDCHSPGRGFEPRRAGQLTARSSDGRAGAFRQTLVARGSHHQAARPLQIQSRGGMPAGLHHLVEELRLSRFDPAVSPKLVLRAP